METCSKIIKEKQFITVWSWRCKKPVYCDGLCKHHYDRMIAKNTSFGQRDGYRQATEEDLVRQKRIYLKTMGSYGGHVCRNGVITIGDANKPTNIPCNPELFVVRIKP